MLLHLIVTVVSVRNRNINALSDEEYDIMIRKITGAYDTPVTERSSKEMRLLRKYSRWISHGKDLTVGPSGKTIYVDGLVRREEIERTIQNAEKVTKNSGIRKLTERIKNRFVGCSEKNVVVSKSNSKCLKV